MHGRGTQAQSPSGAQQTLPEAFAIGLAPSDRAVLHQRIEQRFQQMLDQGLEEEVRQLYERGDLHLNLPSMRAVGYRQMWEYLDGNSSLDEATERAVIATRHLAKRQFTWLRKWPNLHWILTDAEGGVESSDLASRGENCADSAELVLNYLVRNPM